jgi:hypothetical protein
LGGTSYAANALVFAPLPDERIGGGGLMHPATKPNYCDRGSPAIKIQSGTTSIIGFAHSYSLCGSDNKGTSWLYTAGLKSPPGAVQTSQPWSKASYIGQKVIVAPGERAFQNQPSPHDRSYDAATGSGCDPLLPATPHANEIMVVMMGGAARSIARDIDINIWNRHFFPNHGEPNLGIGWAD